MAARRARSAALLGLAMAMVPAACNALIGAPDRALDTSDDGPDSNARDATVVDAAEEPLVVVPEPGDAGDASAVTFIDVVQKFETPNGASFTTTDAGTKITNYGSATHPVIVPMPQPKIPAEDYTVHATVLAPTNGEFGILTRVQPSGAAYVFASKFGSENRQFLGSFSPPDWNPSLDSRVETPYVFVPNGRYKFRLKCVGKLVSGKMWEASQAEPAAFQVAAMAPWATGRGTGYYTYTTNGAVLESLRISVP